MLKTFFSSKPELKSKREIALMRESGKLVAEAHRLCKAMALPGTRTGDIDAAVEALYASRGRCRSSRAIPARCRSLR